MRLSKAIVALEDRHAYLVGKMAAPCCGFVIAEAAALEEAIALMAHRLAEDRALRAARYAAQEHISRSSC